MKQAREEPHDFSRRMQLLPALLPVFLIGAAVAADLLGKLLDEPGLFTVSWYLLPAGVVAALIAEAYRFLGRRRSSAGVVGPRGRVVRLTFVLAASVALLLAWWLRGEAGLSPEGVLLGLEIFAAGVLICNVRGKRYSRSLTPSASRAPIREQAK